MRTTILQRLSTAANLTLRKWSRKNLGLSFHWMRILSNTGKDMLKTLLTRLGCVLCGQPKCDGNIVFQCYSPGRQLGPWTPVDLLVISSSLPCHGHGMWLMSPSPWCLKEPLSPTRTMPISETPGTCGFSSRIVFSPEASRSVSITYVSTMMHILPFPYSWHKSVMWCTSTILINNGKCMQMHIPNKRYSNPRCHLTTKKSSEAKSVCISGHVMPPQKSNCPSQPALHSPIHVHNPSRFWRDIPIRFVWLSLAASEWAGRKK